MCAPPDGWQDAIAANNQAAMDAGADHVSFHPEMAELPAELLPSLRPDDVCITLGAGSIEFLGGDLLAALRGRQGREGSGE